MIFLITVNHDYTYELSNIIKMYFGKEEIKYIKKEALDDSQSFFKVENKVITCTLNFQEHNVTCNVEIVVNGENFTMVEDGVVNDFDRDKVLKYLVKKALYKLLSLKFNKVFPWGILSGIRPIKIVNKLMDKGLTQQEIKNTLANNYLISLDRVTLATEIGANEGAYVSTNHSKKVSIYVGIPFCPSRCYYCSFTSNSMVNYSNYVQIYVEKLISEITEVALYMKERSIEVESVYIGGGTPTSLSAQQLDSLISCINRAFGDSYKEFTCEAGRPDTITAEKLIVLKKAGVTRISINPQTMNDKTLETIGRAHTVKQVIDSYTLAREIGFANINMDIILGLPGEGLEQLKKTLTQINELEPESITVHTMAIKRASILNEKNEDITLKSSIAEEMMTFTMNFMKEKQFLPYYLYRQKHMVENLENIGYCKKGYECIYNIQIIGEKQTNVAFGADAVTKIIMEEQKSIQRQHNIKDLKLYIERVDEMIEKKILLLSQIWN